MNASGVGSRESGADAIMMQYSFAVHFGCFVYQHDDERSGGCSSSCINVFIHLKVYRTGMARFSVAACCPEI